jgi:hypothetical protein
MGEKGILLGFVEAVDLIHKKDCPPTPVFLFFRFLDHLADLFHSGKYGRER